MYKKNLTRKINKNKNKTHTKNNPFNMLNHHKALTIKTIW